MTAINIPIEHVLVLAGVLFALGLTFWVGYTIATIQVDSFDANEPGPAETEAQASPDRPA